MNPLSFCSSRNVLISLSLPKDGFAGYSGLSWWLSFSALNESAHWLPASEAPDEKLADTLIEDQDSPLVFVFGKLDYNVHAGASFEFILIGVHWASWIFIFMNFIKCEMFSTIVSSNILFCRSRAAAAWVLVRWTESRRPLASGYLPQSFFCSSDSLISAVLSATHFLFSSAYADLTLTPSSEFFIVLIVLFSSGIFWSLFVFSISLLIFFSYITFLIFFPSSFSSWAPLREYFNIFA